jgi:hypothetical protein
VLTALTGMSSPKGPPARAVPVLNDIIEIHQHQPGVKYLTGGWGARGAGVERGVRQGTGGGGGG